MFCQTMLATVLVASAVSVDTIGEVAPAFELGDYRGREYTLAEFDESPVVVLVFLGTECPLAKLYGPRLERMYRQFKQDRVAFIGINSNLQDSLTEIAAYARRHEITFPLLKDPGNQYADAIGAQRTPEAFILDRDRKIRYHGRIDDQYGVGYSREAPQQQDLEQAITELLAGDEVSNPTTTAVGCIIGRVRRTETTAGVTYSNQVARVLQKHCIECHRPGQIAPFSLTDYDEVVGWAETIAEVIRDRRMPPWHADPQYGHFLNSRGMSDEEKQVIDDWIAAGTPEGDPSNLPAELESVEGWRLPRQPDLIVPMSTQPFTVPAEGVVEYQYFVVDPGLKEDRWVTAAEVVPGNLSVVHHAIVFIRPPGEPDPRDIGWLTAYVPGQQPTELPEGHAIWVPKGSQLIFQMHYTPTGKEQDDCSQVGLLFADDETIDHRVVTLISMNREFEIPPHASDYSVSSWLSDYPRQSRLLALAPHMHLRGKSFRFELHDGSTQSTILNVPAYDFNWQHSYLLADPLEMDGRRIECIATFDNSIDNLTNPDPTIPVRWGDQTWQEMVVSYFIMAIPRDHPEDPEVERQRTVRLEQQLKQASQQADRMFQDHDANRDGQLLRDEFDGALRGMRFREMDLNGDNVITRDEVERRAFRSIRRRDDT